MKSYSVIDGLNVVNNKVLTTQEEAVEERNRLQELHVNSSLKIQLVEVSLLKGV